MSLYFTIPFLMLLAIFQGTAAPQIRVASGHPDLLLVAILSWELVHARGEGYVWAFVGGLIQDLISGGPFGASILGYLAVALVADRVGGGLYRDRLALPVMVALIGTLAYHAVYLLTIRFFGWPLDLADALFRVALPSALVNALLAPIMARLMLALHRRVTPPGVPW